MIGVYKITNIATNKSYIGKSIDIKRRFRKHKYYLNNEQHHNMHLQRSWNLYGEENFNFSIIEECKEEELDYLEMYYIQKYDTVENGFNMNYGGECGRGYKHTEEFKIKQSVNNRNGNNSKAKKVICEGIIFDSIKECAEYYNVSRSAMYHWLYDRKMRQDFVEKGLRYLN